MRNSAARIDGTQRGRILDKSARLFAHKGFEETSINDIADEVNISKATIYHYFKSKDEIYTEIIVVTLEGLLAAVQAAVRPSDPPTRRLESFMETHARFFEDNFWAFTAMLIGFGGIRHLSQRARAVDLRDQYEEVLRGILRDGIREGQFREIDPIMAGRAILSVLNWMARWFKPGGSKRAHEFAREYANLLVFGLHAPGLTMEPPSRGNRRRT